MGRRDGGAYGTSLFVGLFIARRRDLRDEPPSGTEALTGRVLTGRVITGRRHLRDEHPYGTLNCGAEGLTGRRRLRDESAYVITGRTRLRDEPPYGTFAGRKRLRDELLTGRTFRQLRRPSL